MENVKQKLTYKSKRVVQYGAAFLKWVFIALLTGLIGGAVGGAFRFCIEFVTEIRTANEFLIYFLPFAGLLIVFLYKISKLTEEADTNLVLKSVRENVKVPFILAPVIFVSTVITHLFGGSVGKEGAALQLGGCLGKQVGGLFHLDDADMRIAALCGMSGLFSALFSTPVTATIFVMEVISVGVFYYSAFIPCIVSAIVSLTVTNLMGLENEVYVLSHAPEASLLTVVTVSVVAIACAIVGILFCLMLRLVKKVSKKYLKNDYLRIFVGGAVIVLLSVILGTRYSGVGMSVIDSAFEYENIYWYDPFMKILFTSLAIGVGFKGGEIVPTLFVGATLGYVVGDFIGLDPAFAAAVGMVALFCAMVNCPIASIMLSVEMFSGGSVVLFAVAVGISFMLSGYYGLYHGQKILYSKRKARFVDRYAK